MTTKKPIGNWRRLAQVWRCARGNCNDRMAFGQRVLILSDGRAYCETHGDELRAAAEKGRVIPDEDDLSVAEVKQRVRKSKRTDKTIPA